MRGNIQLTLYVVNENDARFVLNGLYLVVKEKRMTVVGTDGHRLAVETWQGLVPEEVSWSGIVPKKAIQQLAKRLDGLERVILGVTYGRMFSAWVGGYRFTSRMIEGKYPNWQRLVPQKAPANALTVDREELAEAVKRVALVSGSGLITLEYVEAGLILSCQSPEHGEARETVDGSYVGEPFRTGFQAHYLSAILGALEGPTVVLQQEGPLGTCLVTDPSVTLCRTLVMPIRLG